MSTPRAVSAAFAGFLVVAEAGFAEQVPARVAGSVADANEDGAGDNHSALPGSSPSLAAAAVNASGGSGSNGTQRFHIEWPLAELPFAVASAQVGLTAFQGSIDSLDTTFWVAAGDGDGILDDADFQTPATQIAGVVLPVTANPGTASLFTFDVTDELNAALAAGFDFFVLQGRVDESLVAGTTFARGLQIRTSATSNSASQLPLLVFTPASLCAGDAHTLCLRDRFEVTASFRTDTGLGGAAHAVELTPDSGFFYFINPQNVEMIVKVHDACVPPFNRYWVFSAGLTNVEVELRVRDLAAGEEKSYFNPLDRPYPPILDTDAFATCP